MILIPAIDIKDGRCVRLKQGKMDEATVYSDDPLEVAKRWHVEGAQRLHVVDLDGAISGYPVHVESICKIVQSVPLPIQIGGGIRRMEQIERYMAAGAAYVVLGTSILHDEALVSEAVRRFPGQIIAGIDCKQGHVAIRGWVALSDCKPTDLACKMEAIGCSSLIITDIEKDGMLAGPNINLFHEMSQTVHIPLIASGGVTTLDDIRRLHAIPGILSAIIGKAFYSGALSYQEAMRALKEGPRD